MIIMNFFSRKNKVHCFFFIYSLGVLKLHDHTTPSPRFFLIFNKIMKQENRARKEIQAVSSRVYTANLKPLDDHVMTKQFDKTHFRRDFHQALELLAHFQRGPL
jgi:hypothetical protein